MLDNLKKYHIVLVSASPRRRELLKNLGLNFKVRTLFGLDESYPESLRGEDIPAKCWANLPTPTRPAPCCTACPGASIR